MPKPKSSPAKNASACVFDPASRITVALQYHRRAESAAHQMAIWGALCGLELQAMKKECQHGVWQGFYETNVEQVLPLRTAQYYMAVAEGLKVKARRAADGEITFAAPRAELDTFLAKRPAAVAAGRLVQLTGHFERRYTAQTWALLQTPPHRLTDAQRARLAAAVESVADGETMASLVEAYRLTKKPAGSGVEGGYRPDPAKLAEFLGAYHPALAGKGYDELPAEVQAHFRKWAAQRVNDPAQLAFDFCKPALDVFEHPDFEGSLDRMPEAEARRMLDHAEAIAHRLRERFRAAKVTTRKAA